jgi:hypothetical protein
VSGTLSPVTAGDVDALEQQLSTTCPRLSEYVTTFGAGTLDMLVEVSTPWQILAQLDDHRSRMAAYWFWGDGALSFGQEEALESIPFGDTVDGDGTIVFAQGDPRLFILPREDDTVVSFDGLLALLGWICAGGLGHEPRQAHSFEPWESPSKVDDASGSVRGKVALATGPAPDLTRGPLEVLLAYFAELAEVEEWAAATDTECQGRPWRRRPTLPRAVGSGRSGSDSYGTAASPEDCSMGRSTRHLRPTTRPQGSGSWRPKPARSGRIKASYKVPHGAPAIRAAAGW